MRHSSRYNLKKPLDPEKSSDREIAPRPKIDVTEMLKDNLAKQQQHEKPIDLKKAKSKKKRDYILGMIFVNLAIIIPFFILDKNIVTGVFSLSGIVIFSSAFTWAMWQVIGDY